MKERDLYKPIKHFLEDKYKEYVLNSGIRVGVKGEAGGTVDVVVVRGIYSNYLNTCEIISVEAKLYKRPFLTNIRQALRYSIFSDRCYLAVPEEFNQKEIDIADSLGVGLIELKNKKSKEILSSKLFTPNEHLKLKLLSNLDIYKCAICGSCFLLESESQKLSNAVKNKASYLLRLKEQDKKLLEKGIPDRKSYWVRHNICKDCVSGIFSELKEICSK